MKKVNHIAYAIILRELLDGEMTAHDAAEISGLYITTTQQFFKTLRDHKVLHICAWEPNSRGIDTTPVYRLGEGKDKPKRKRTPAERQAKHRAKKKVDMVENFMFGAMQ